MQGISGSRVANFQGPNIHYYLRLLYYTGVTFSLSSPGNPSYPKAPFCPLGPGGPSGPTLPCFPKGPSAPCSPWWPFSPFIPGKPWKNISLFYLFILILYIFYFASCGKHKYLWIRRECRYDVLYDKGKCSWFHLNVINFNGIINV